MSGGVCSECCAYSWVDVSSSKSKQDPCVFHQTAHRKILGEEGISSQGLPVVHVRSSDDTNDRLAARAQGLPSFLPRVRPFLTALCPISFSCEIRPSEAGLLFPSFLFVLDPPGLFASAIGRSLVDHNHPSSNRIAHHVAPGFRHRPLLLPAILWPRLSRAKGNRLIRGGFKLFSHLFAPFPSGLSRRRFAWAHGITESSA